jgi:pseudouridine kinase
VPAEPRVVCIGGVVQDRKLHLHAPAVPGTSNPGTGSGAAGGVGRNVAENLARLGVRVAMVSRVGADPAGSALIAGLEGLGVDVAGVTVEPQAGTAEYLAVLDPGGELVLGVADTAILERITVADVAAAWPAAGWVFADCNLAPAVLAHLLARGRREGSGGPVRVTVDAVSTPKVTRLPADLGGVGLLFCNRDEARALLAHCARPGVGAQPRNGGAEDEDEALVAGLLAAGAAGVVLTRGSDGVIAADAAHADRPWHVPAVPAAVVDVTGAGDALVAGVLAGLVQGRSIEQALALGTLTAALTVECDRSVRPDLGPGLVADELESRSR